MGFRINLLGGNEESGETSVILISFFLIAGVILTGYGFTQYRGQSQSLDNAASINATVIDMNVRTDSSRRGGIDYQAEITFEYRYEGQSYSSDFIYPLDDDRKFSTESEAQQYLESYSTGGAVEAFVNPENPGNGFLNAQRSNQPLIMMLIGIFMISLAVYKLSRRVV